MPDESALLITQLQTPLYSEEGKMLPQRIQQRLCYLWRSVQETIEHSREVSQSMRSMTFSSICLKEGVALPFVLDEKLCKFCKVLLVPTITARVRLQKRCRRSRVNRKISNKSKLIKNEMVYTCLNCNADAFTMPVCNRRDKSKKITTPAAAAKTTEKFSFQNELSKSSNKASLSGDFIPIRAKTAPTSSTVPSSGTVNLLDLERQNKKKRKSLQKSAAEPAAVKKPNPGGPSLGSLQSLMNRNT